MKSPSSLTAWGPTLNHPTRASSLTRFWRQTAILASVVFAVVRPASATSIYFQGWDHAGNAQGWTANVLGSSVSVPGAGGDPDGYLAMSGNTVFPVIGAVANFAPPEGNYAALGVDSVSFALDLFSGTFTQETFRVRYLNATFNGWQFPFPYNAAAGGWQGFVIFFNPMWTDAQATANGWFADGPIGPNQQSFAVTMTSVFNPEIRLTGVGNSLSAGLDDFNIDATGTTAVPEPATVTLVSCGLIGLARHVRRRRKP
jgi:hypothetical protein